MSVVRLDKYENREYAECQCGSRSFHLMAHNPDGESAIVDGFECIVCGMTTWLEDDDEEENDAD